MHHMGDIIGFLLFFIVFKHFQVNPYQTFSACTARKVTWYWFQYLQSDVGPLQRDELYIAFHTALLDNKQGHLEKPFNKVTIILSFAAFVPSDEQALADVINAVSPTRVVHWFTQNERKIKVGSCTRMRAKKTSFIVLCSGNLSAVRN